MKNREIAGIFNEIADILELKGENRFRIAAYRRAAQALESLPEDVEELASTGRLSSIPGIGKDLEGKILEYIEKGEVSFLTELRKETPRVLLDMLKVPGIGPKTAVLIYDELGVESLEELKKAAEEHRIQGLPKIKAKTEENILKGIEFLEKSMGRTPIGSAYPLARKIVETLLSLPEVGSISPAGSLRRFKETIGDIDILVTSTSPDRVIEHFTGMEDVERVLASGKTKASVITKENIQVDLRVVEEESFGSALNYFTGSKEHNIRLREIAMQKGLKLNEYGVFKKLKTGEKKIAGRTEEDVYKALGMDYIPPEIREDSGEIEAAVSHKLPKLVEKKDIKGDLHVHSTYSDGSISLEELAQIGKRLGYRYILVSDHSKSLRIANGLSRDELLMQIEEIDKINARLKGFRLLKGSEVDILPDGSLDYDDEILSLLDIVIIAVHSKFKMKRNEMTRRITRALRNPYANILAHPTGRVIGTRDEYELDMDEVFRVAAETNTAIEINCHPFRLDLDSKNVRKAIGMGVMITLGTDTHRFSEFEYIDYGVGIARRGWATKASILNTLSADRLIRTLKKKSTGKSSD